MKIEWMLMECVLLLTVVTACSTTEPRDSKDRPRIGVIGHGTTPGSSWAGVGVKVPFPSKQPAASSPSSSELDSKEAGKQP